MCSPLCGFHAVLYGWTCLPRPSDRSAPLSPETGSWQELRTGPGPTEGRHDHSAVSHDSSMWVFGGMTDLAERSDLWRLDLGRSGAAGLDTLPSLGRQFCFLIRLLLWCLGCRNTSVGTFKIVFDLRFELNHRPLYMNMTTIYEYTNVFTLYNLFKRKCCPVLCIPTCLCVCV